MRRSLAVLAAAALVYAPAATAWSWPVDGPVLRPFVFGNDPYAAGQHRGIDIGATVGTTVRAATGGTVSFTGTVPTGGRALTVRTAEGLSVTYLELGSTHVARGAEVVEGDPIGTIGSAAHVHFGVRVTADQQGYLDPLLFLPARTTPADARPDSVAEPSTMVDPVPAEPPAADASAPVEPVATEPTASPVPGAPAAADPIPVVEPAAVADSPPTQVPPPVAPPDAIAAGSETSAVVDSAAGRVSPEPVDELAPAEPAVSAPVPAAEPTPTLEPVPAAAPATALPPISPPARLEPVAATPAAAPVPTVEPASAQESVAQSDPPGPAALAELAEPVPEADASPTAAPPPVELVASDPVPGPAAEAPPDAAVPAPAAEPASGEAVPAAPAAFGRVDAVGTGDPDRTVEPRPMPRAPEPLGRPAAVPVAAAPVTEVEPVPPTAEPGTPSAVTPTSGPADPASAHAAVEASPPVAADEIVASTPEPQQFTALDQAALSGLAVIDRRAAVPPALAPSAEPSPSDAASLGPSFGRAVVQARPRTRHTVRVAATQRKPVPGTTRSVESDREPVAVSRAPARDEDPESRSMTPVALVGLLALALVGAAVTTCGRRRQGGSTRVVDAVGSPRCPLGRSHAPRLIHDCARAPAHGWVTPVARAGRITPPHRPLPRPRKRVLGGAGG